MSIQVFPESSISLDVSKTSSQRPSVPPGRTNIVNKASLSSVEAPQFHPLGVGCNSIVEILQRNALQHPDHTCLMWVDSNCKVKNTLNYQQLWSQSGAVANLLCGKGVKRRDRVMVAYPFGLEFLDGFFGCMRAGVIPCSVYPPNLEKGRAQHSFAQFNTQVKDAGAKFALTNSKFRTLMRSAPLLVGQKTNVKWLVTDGLPVQGNSRSDVPSQKASPEDIAFIQYSSGSTGAPKGVMISHRAIMHNLGAILTSIVSQGHGPSRVVSWLPQYHDFGLVICFLGPTLCPDYTCVNCSPIDFIKNPLLWADMLDHFEATDTVGPNFAYALLAKRMKAANRKLQNSRLHQACIAAEPIAPSTLQAMVSIGIPRRALRAGYGMSECCVYATSSVGDEIRILGNTISSGLIARNEAYGMKIIIAHPENRVQINDGRVGEILVSGPDLASGYWGKPELSREFRLSIDGNTFFATGDLGFIVEGRLYVTGRSKELIIINGRNVYPTDLERSIEGAYTNLIRPGSTVAYQHTSTGVGLVLELRKTVSNIPGSLLPELRSLVGNAHDVDVVSLYLLKQGTVPKTTSGKLRRREAARLCVENEWSPKTVINKWQKISGDQVSQDLSCQQAADEVVRDVPQTLEAYLSGKGESIEGIGHTNLQQLKDSGESSSSVPSPPIDFDALMGDFFDDMYDPDLSWEEHGMSSIASVELRNSINSAFQVSLPPDCFERFPTPATLRASIMSMQGTSLSTNLPKLQEIQSMRVAWHVMGVIQGLGICLLCFLFAASIVPAYFLVNWLSSDNTEVLLDMGGRYVKWMWLPLAIPTWMLSFSLSVVLAKWVVVGRYQECEIPVFSIVYIRWWWVDRAVHLWEFWVGRYIVATPLLWLFYCLMGATIHPSTILEAFIHEFDLVHIEEGVSIENDLRCHKFSAWEDDDGPTLRFRPISIAKDGKIHGMLSPGVCVGTMAFVERLAVVPEGAEVPDGSYVKGNPAFNDGSAPQAEKHVCWWQLGTLKILWMVAELYIFFGTLLVGQVILNDRLPNSWRYTPLCYWFLLIGISVCLSIPIGIILKWILIGRRRPGPATESLFRKAADWAADYHFGISCGIILSLSSNSHIWNLILGLYGMDIDYSSKVTASNFPPSKVDLIQVRSSFLSQVNFDVKKDGTYHITVVTESSIGYRVCVGPGVNVSNATIPPMTHITESMSENTGSNSRPTSASVLVRHSLAVDVLYIGLVAALLVSLVPSYELWSLLSPRFIWTAAPVFSLALGVQTAWWTLLFILVQNVSHLQSRKRTSPWNLPLYTVYMTVCWSLQTWSFLPLLWGSPIFSVVARILGTSIKGRVIYNGIRIYDWPYITLTDKTVVNSSVIFGHYQVFNEATLGPAKVSGTLHEGCFLHANSVASSRESGPWQYIVGSLEENKLRSRLSEAAIENAVGRQLHLPIVRSDDSTSYEA